jgi:hypothetical protein
MEKLSSHLSLLWPTIVKGFENHINKIWSDCFFETFSEWKKNAPTQEITKVLSPFFTAYLKKTMSNIGFMPKESKGLDYIWENFEIEGKLSLSSANSWTGNGFPKTNWHLLIKLKFDDDGKILGSFVCLVPLNECYSDWTKSGTKDNFSTLKLRVEDYYNIIKIVGDLKFNRIYLEPIFV